MQIESERIEKYILWKWNPKKDGVIIFLSDKINSARTVATDKEGHYIMTSRKTQQEDITITNIYVPSVEAPKYIKPILTT